MKKYLLTAFIALIASPALADGLPCEDSAKLIAELEQEKQQGRLSGNREQTINSLLAAAYETLRANSCPNKK